MTDALANNFSIFSPHSSLSDLDTWLSSSKTGDAVRVLTFAVTLMVCRVAVLKTLVAIGRSGHGELFRITRKPAINEKQLERESVWPLGFFLDVIAMVLINVAGFWANLPIVEGTLIAMCWNIFFHATIVEFLYYLFHRALHYPSLYKRWHQYHHKSINTEPTTAVSFEVGERLAYTVLFAIAPIVTALVSQQTFLSIGLYFVFFDILNEGGHINFEVLPSWFFSTPLKYIIYSPTFHAVHHTKFKKNYSLFMPWTDIVFGTAVYTGEEGASAANASDASENV